MAAPRRPHGAGLPLPGCRPSASGGPPGSDPRAGGARPGMGEGARGARCALCAGHAAALHLQAARGR